MVLSQERSLLTFFNLYMPTTPPYESLRLPTRAPRMWGVERDPGAPLGRRGVQRGGLVVVFGGSRVGGGGGAAARHLGVPGGEERCATGVYDLPCAPMGVPRVWAIEGDHMQPLGEWGTHR